MRKSTLEKLNDSRRKKNNQSFLTPEDLFLLLLDGSRPKEKRQANPTQISFVFDPAPNKAFMGAAGSAKTSALCSAGWLRALLQPGSKGLVARANYNDLMDTTGRRMQEMLGRLPLGVLLDRDKSPPMKWYVKPVARLYPDGSIQDDTPSEITFMGLSDDLGSYEFNWAIVDEADEVEHHAVNQIFTRLRHRTAYYDELTPEEKASYFSLMLAFNPPDVTHWLYTECTGLDQQGRKVKEPSFKLFTPMKAENCRNLPTNYYENLTRLLPKDMQTRLVEGQWGVVFKGDPVYRQFSPDIHVRDALPYDPYSPLYRFWDFGYRHPYCVFAQSDVHGRLFFLREVTATDTEIVPFANLVVSRGEQHFPGHREFIDYGDPAARQKKDTGSTLVELAKAGITLRYKISMIEDGLRTGRHWMETLIDKQPALQFARHGVPMLIRALSGGYHLDDNGKPVKDGDYDHSADAFRYGIVNVMGIHDTKKFTDLPASLEYDGSSDIYGRP